MKKISLEKFINETKGKVVDFPNTIKETKVKGQCVTLIQNYIYNCLNQPAIARGNAKDWIRSYVKEGLGYTVSDQRNGDILVFPNEGEGYGHIGIYFEGMLYDQNNFSHDDGKAGLTKIFSTDYVTLRPKTEVIVYEPKIENNQYLNLSPIADTWRVYPMNLAPVIGNECKVLLPKKFKGLSYTIKGYTSKIVAVIETRDFGEVQIYIDHELANITDKPMYGLVK